MSGCQVRPTVAVVNLMHLNANFERLREVVQVPIWGVVKADGYGHGACQVARSLESAGAMGLCVSLLEEGIELREAGIALPILVMGGCYRGSYGQLRDHNLIPVISQIEQLQGCAREVRRAKGERFEVHLKLDTGMARLGATPEQWRVLAGELQKCPEILVSGLMTHLACAGEDAQSVETQLRRFAKGCEVMAPYCERGFVRHAANTAGALAHPESRLDWVRIGIGLYGYAPGVESPPRLLPVMSVRTQIVALRTLVKGEAVGYGATYCAPGTVQIATVPLGYADGLCGAQSGRGELLLRGRRVPIVGAISMDMTTLNVSGVAGVQVGDEVVYLGEAANRTDHCHRERMGADDIAESAGTIPWEVLTAISRRVPRRYL